MTEPAEALEATWDVRRDPALERPITLADLRIFEATYLSRPTRSMPPCDLDAEHAIAERILSGKVRPGHLGELRGRDFFLEELGWIVDAGVSALELGAVPSPQLLGEVLERQGFPEGCAERLARLLATIPATAPARLPRLVQRVRALARLRRALRAVLDAEMAIRADQDGRQARAHLELALRHLEPAPGPARVSPPRGAPQSRPAPAPSARPTSTATSSRRT